MYNMKIYNKKLVTESIVSESLGSLKQIISESCRLHLEVFNDFQNILCEEGGIYLKNRVAANEIVKLIKGSIKENKCNVKIDERRIKHYIGELSYFNDGISVLVKYDVINFINDEIFDGLYSYYNLDGSFNEEENSISVPIAMINGKLLVETATGSIQHELSHLLDSKFNKNSDRKDRDSVIYKICVGQMKAPMSNESYELARAIYITFKSEQIAMANSLDALLENDTDNVVDYRETDEYRYLINLKKIISNFNNYKVLIEKVYQCNPDKMLKILIESYHEYARRLGRVITLHNYKNI